MTKFGEKIRLHRALFLLSIMILPLVSFALLYVYVNFNSFLLAFQSIDIAGNYTFVGWENFKEFFGGTLADGNALPSFLNSLRMWWTVFVITTPLYLLFSYYIAKKLPASKFASVIVMLPQVVSAMVFALVYKEFTTYSLKEILVAWGLYPAEMDLDIYFDVNLAYANNLFYTIWVSFGTSVLLYTNAMRAIDGEIIESAALDGAGGTREFFSIILPLIWPTFTTNVVTGAASMFTYSGSLLVFYMSDAPNEIWGLGYFFQKMVGLSGNHNIMNYPAVATAGMVSALFTAPVVFAFKAIMNKCDRTEN